MDCGECCQVQFYKYVALIRGYQPDKLIELCHVHLAPLLELSKEKLRILLSGHEENNKKKHNRKFGLPFLGMFKNRDKSHGLFGLPLTDEGVCFIMPLIKYLKMENNITTEGLFRKPGNKIKIAALKELLIAQGPTVSIDSEIFSANDVASVLKEFIRELPEPLITERHLEIHMQILALGQHAKTEEDIARYSSRKLSALQLLMLLLPSPAQKLTMNLVQLLQKTANSPESKMTPITLGTIFAPIFFIEKKVEPTDLLIKIITTAPAVAFMIDKAHELFQPPKELFMDFVKCWKSLRQAHLETENNVSDQMEKSLDGQTLCTNLCYDEHKLSKCDDGTGDTAKDLNLQTQPNTKKSCDTPGLCSGLLRRSRSIGSSIKKRLTSLRRLRDRQSDTLRSRASSSNEDSKTATSDRTCELECPSQTLETRHSLLFPKPGLEGCYRSENCPSAVSSSSDLPAYVQTLPNTHIDDAPELRRRGMSISYSVRKRLTSLTRLRSRTSSSSPSSNSKTTPSAKPDLLECSTQAFEARHSQQIPKPGHKSCYSSENCPTAVSSSSSETPAKWKCQETTSCKVTLTVTVDLKHPNEACCATPLASNKHSANVDLDFVENRDSKSFTSDLEDSATCDMETKGNTENTATCDIEKKGAKITMSVNARINSTSVTNTCHLPSRKPETAVIASAIIRQNQDNILETAV